MAQHNSEMFNQVSNTQALCCLSILVSAVMLNMVCSSAFVGMNHHGVTLKEDSSLIAKSRYSAGLVCKDRGWEFCASWANIKRIPGSRIA
ncbi:hypothetical protein [Shewanella kaireitica]|uniref:hypothetical protein n=1 Tax=Shewanella kaireitica TaxID=212021 RepID=UPI00200FD7C9|nr:hypothetical protein [Shewanella kaireitica]MCL1096029.1 hypothetical protein [Shewanella kaireitica]